MKTKSKYVLWSGVAAVVAALLIAALRPEAVNVETATARKAPMIATVQDRGETRVLDRFVVSAPVAGELVRIPLRAGDAVRKGDIVAQIRPSRLSAVATGQTRAAVVQAEAALRETSARVAAAKARVEYAERELRRISAMHSQGIASNEALDAARSSAETARSDVQAATASEAQARAALDAAKIATLPLTEGTGVINLFAPVDARIFAIPDRSARAVMPGEPVLTLGNPREIEAVIDVLSEDAVRISPGQRALLVDWGGERPLEGVVRQVEASAFTKVSALGIEEQRVHVIVSIPDPPPSLGDAYRVQGRIVVWSSPSALQIPVGALTRFEERWGAWVLADGRARRRVISIGHRNDEAAEVLSGLREGEPVAMHPADDIAEGVRVTSR